jgi:hypothetical protein
MATKEIRYLQRDPFFKVTLMNLVYMMVVGLFSVWRASTARPGGSGSGLMLQEWILWGASGFLLFGVTGLMFNLWGTEGRAATTLFLFPSERRY